VKLPLDPSLLLIRQLTENDKDLLAPFTAGDHDLDDFLKSDAWRLQELNVVKTYLALYQGEGLVGYISLLADAVVLETKERKKLSLSHQDHPVIPALKVARLAVRVDFRDQYRGGGEALVRFAYTRALLLSDIAGVRLLTLDAYPQSVEFYKKLGFVENKAKVYQEKMHPSMRFDLFAPTLPAWVYPPKDESPIPEEPKPEE
jgi:GNAT superfamily N-acetyltransferase